MAEENAQQEAGDKNQERETRPRGSKHTSRRTEVIAMGTQMAKMAARAKPVFLRQCLGSAYHPPAGDHTSVG